MTARLVLLLLMLTPFVASADDAAQARFHDERARAHYAAGRYERALQEFFAEQRITPTPRTLYNIALCFDRLRRDEEAFLFFAEYVSSDDDDRESRRFAEETIARLRPRLALVEVRSEPSATLYVDRRERGSFGSSPRVLPLSPGAHRVELVREGYEPTTVEVEARVGEQVVVEVSLERVLGELRVRGPEGTHVVVLDADGRPAAEGPLPWQGRLPPSRYVLEVTGEGWLPWRGLAQVRAGGSTEAVATPTSRPPPTGEMTVTSNAVGALVLVDGEAAGFAPAVLDGLSLGTHRVRLEQDGLETWEGDVELRPRERAWLTATLEPPARLERSPFTWVVGGVGVASLLSGSLTGVFAMRAHRDFTNEPSAETRDVGRRLTHAADVSFGLALVSAVTFVVTWFTTARLRGGESRGVVSHVP